MSGALSGWYYLVSGFFVLDTMQAFGFIDLVVYGPWSPGSDKITQTLNLVMIAASLTLFGNSYRRREMGFAAGGVVAFLVVGFLCLPAVWPLSPPTTLRDGGVYLFALISVITLNLLMIAASLTLFGNSYLR